MTLQISTKLLSHLSFSSFEDTTRLANPHKPHIYLGVGFISKEKNLSDDLPVDILKMLLSAKILLEQRSEHLKLDSRLFICLADSLAEREGAPSERLSVICKVYHEKISDLLGQLKLQESASILLTSHIERDADFQSLCEIVRSHSATDAQPSSSQEYVTKQTAITRWLHVKKDVGCKIGWITKQRLHLSPYEPTPWDEKRFDDIYTKIFEERSFQFFYSKAGLKLRKGSFIETCPYIGAHQDKRFFLKDSSSSPVKRLAKAEAKTWEDIPELCQQLKDLGLVDAKIIQDGCILPRNKRQTALNFLRHLTQ